VEYGGPAVEAAVARLHRPPHLPEELPDGVRALLARMLAVDPKERPTASEAAARWDAPLLETAASPVDRALADPAPVDPAPVDRAPVVRLAAAPARPRPPGRASSGRRWPVLLAAAALAVTGMTGAAAVAVATSEPAPAAPLPAPAVPGDTGRALDGLHEAVNR
jgi:hypothetical protein